MHLRSKDIWPRGAAEPVGCQAPVQQQPLSQQPSLTVDRDPVASPDADSPVKGGTEAPQGAPGAGIPKEGGKFTLREDAFEVRLDATVLDGRGASRQSL